MGENGKLALVGIICLLIGMGVALSINAPEAKESSGETFTGVIYFGRETRIVGDGWGSYDHVRVAWVKEDYLTVFAGYRYEGYAFDVKIIEGQEYYFEYSGDFKIIEVFDDKIIIELID